MKSLITTMLLSPLALALAAQEPADTLATKQLGEVVIEAPKVIRKADMDLYYPSRSAVENAKTGMQLLNNLMIPGLTVTDALGTIKAAGESVQVRINGRESSVEQVRALLPETIKRVEWIDNPGLRYKGANYVLNFIVTNPTVGGSLQTSARQALNQGWGNYWANVKLNSGASQFEVGADLKLTEHLKTHRDYTEKFTFTDGQSLTRTESSRGGRLDNTFGSLRAAYSYIKPDTTVFMVDLYANHKFSDLFKYDGLLSLSNGADDRLLSDSHGDRGTTPSLSAYLEQHLPKRQIIVVDFKSSLYFGKSYSDYQEQLPGASDYLTDIHTMIKDRNQAYAIEADYIKNWNTSRLTAGVSYSANRNRSVYENLGGAVFHQRQDNLYFFGEYFRRFNKVTLTGGLGARYNNFLFRETNEGNHTWSLSPKATVTYSPSQNHQLRLVFNSWQSTPSLAETNVTPQQIDGFQWRIGNPDLKTSTSYMLFFTYRFSAPRVNGTFGIRAFSSPDAITPLLYWADNRLVTTYENSRGLQNLSFFLAPQIDIIPKWVMASGYLEYRAERMRGTGYTLHNAAWSGTAAVMVTHWGFTFACKYNRAQHDLWGEKISWGENVSIIDLSYNWKRWQFSAGMLMPFGRYDQGFKMLSRWNTSEQHMRLDMRMPYISINYNLQWGRQKRGAQKLVNANANVDTSTAGGR